MDKDKKITKQAPTLAIDGFNITFSNNGKTGSYVDIQFLEDVDDKNAMVVASVRLTLDQYDDFYSKIVKEAPEVDKLRMSQR